MIRSDHEEILDTYPERVALAKEQWRKARADREKLEATLYLSAKNNNKDLTATEIRAIVQASPQRYESVLIEAAFEKIYESLLETLRVHKADSRNYI